MKSSHSLNGIFLESKMVPVIGVNVLPQSLHFQRRIPRDV
jgi:hypothetical protein